MDTATGFHEGELAVQEKAGVRAEAQRLSGMLAPADLTGGAGKFLAAQRLLVLTARDDSGRLWASPLSGPSGFLEGIGTALEIAAAPAGTDPLAGLPAAQCVGLIAIEYETRRRLRVNGTLSTVDQHRLRVDVEQAYGNCPQYIRRRHVVSGGGVLAPGETAVRGTSLTSHHADSIWRVVTFFLGTAHPSRGVDASHRGGPPGFVRVDGRRLWWPDYPGNNMFNSLGNLAVDDTAALLFLDFTTGATLHLSGTASVEWAWPDVAADAAETGRRVTFSLDAVTETRGLGVREAYPTEAPHAGGNP